MAARVRKSRAGGGAGGAGNRIVGADFVDLTSFTERSDRPSARTGPVGVSTPSFALLASGNTASEYLPLSNAYLFDGKGTKWKAVKAGPLEDTNRTYGRAHCIAGSYFGARARGRVFVIGPDEEDKSAPSSSKDDSLDVLYIDEAALTRQRGSKTAWKQIDSNGPGVPQVRRNFASAAAGCFIYVFGGRVNKAGSSGKGRMLGGTHCFNAKTGEWVVPSIEGPAPCARAYAAMTTVEWKGETKLFLFGGYNGKAQLDDLHCLTITGDARGYWEPMPAELQSGGRDGTGARPLVRNTHTLASCGPWLILFGGRHIKNRTNQLRVLDTTRLEAWQSPPLGPGQAEPTSRDAHVFLRLPDVANTHPAFVGIDRELDSDDEDSGKVHMATFVVFGGYSSNARWLDDTHLFRLTWVDNVAVPDGPSKSRSDDAAISDGVIEIMSDSDAAAPAAGVRRSSASASTARSVRSRSSSSPKASKRLRKLSQSSGPGKRRRQRQDSLGSITDGTDSEGARTTAATAHTADTTEQAPRKDTAAASSTSSKPAPVSKRGRTVGLTASRSKRLRPRSDTDSTAAAGSSHTRSKSGRSDAGAAPERGGGADGGGTVSTMSSEGCPSCHRRKVALKKEQQRARQAARAAAEALEREQTTTTMLTKQLSDINETHGKVVGMLGAETRKATRLSADVEGWQRKYGAVQEALASLKLASAQFETKAKEAHELQQSKEGELKSALEALEKLQHERDGLFESASQAKAARTIAEESSARSREDLSKAKGEAAKFRETAEAAQEKAAHFQEQMKARAREAAEAKAEAAELSKKLTETEAVLQRINSALRQ